MWRRDLVEYTLFILKYVPPKDKDINILFKSKWISILFSCWRRRLSKFDGEDSFCGRVYETKVGSIFTSEFNWKNETHKITKIV